MIEYTWVVVYRGSDEQVHPEIGWAGVDIPNVNALIVYEVDNPTHHYVVRCAEGIRPIFYQTIQQVIKQTIVDGELRQESQPSQTTKTTTFGWQKTVNGKNVKSLVRIHHTDGSIEVMDREPS